jgi:hypothetical protein
MLMGPRHVALAAIAVNLDVRAVLELDDDRTGDQMFDAAGVALGGTFDFDFCGSGLAGCGRGVVVYSRRYAGWSRKPRGNRLGGGDHVWTVVEGGSGRRDEAMRNQRVCAR